MSGRQESGALAEIDGALSLSDPRLAGMFSVFTRLAADEQMPATEQVRPRGPATALLAFPALILALLAALAVACQHSAVRASWMMRLALRRPAPHSGPIPLERDKPWR